MVTVLDLNHERRGRLLATKTPNRNVLLIGCSDQKGLVHQITGVLYRSGLNIVRNGEFVDEDNSVFYMRTEFEGVVNSDEVKSELAGVVPEGAWINLFAPRRKKVVVLASKAGASGFLLKPLKKEDFSKSLVEVMKNYNLQKKN